MRVVSLAGPKGSGKNALASAIARQIPVQEVAFADPIRWACDAAGIPFHVTRGLKEEVTGHVGQATGRAVLLALGEAMRGVYPDFWADHMFHRLNELAEAEPHAAVIVTDTRRENEVATLDRWHRVDPKGRHLARLWVERPGYSTDEVLERSVKARCVVVQNNGTLSDLEAYAAGIAAWLADGGPSL